jgi:hypothetical protein
MYRHRRSSFPVALLAATGIWTLACDTAPRAEGDVLAVANKSALTVDEAAEILLTEDQLPAQPEVVLAIADLWADYILLATAAMDDPDLGNVDLSPLLRQRRQQALVEGLREEVIQVDTAITEEQLQAAFDEEKPGAEVRARHILLSYPDQATPEQRDSVNAFAASLAERARAGEDFAEMATEYSRDTGTAARGGDLGFFRRGAMVEPFEEAAFAMSPGEISDPVVSPFGVHVIKLEEQRGIPLDSIRSQFRLQVQSRLVYEAESTFVAGVRDPAGITVTEEAPEVVRELARTPNTVLRGSARSRALVTFEGGEVTAREVQVFVQGQTPSVRNQIAAARDEQLENLLTGIAQTELLAARAEADGVEYTQETADSVELDLRISLRNAADGLGIRRTEVQEGESEADAVERVVRVALEGILSQRLEVIALGPVSFSLRERYGADINTDAVDAVLERVAAAREGGPAPEPGPTDAVQPDTAGGGEG